MKIFDIVISTCICYKSLIQTFEENTIKKQIFPELIQEIFKVSLPNSKSGIVYESLPHESEGS